MEKEDWINILICIIVLLIIIFMISILLTQIGERFIKLPPPNSTEEWKQILSNDNPCKWYQLGCQRLECVIDCKEINKEAGEIICVC